MSLTGLSYDVLFTWKLLFGVHETVKRRELSNSAALEALSSFCVTDKGRLQIEAELEAHLLPLYRKHDETSRQKTVAKTMGPRGVKPQWTKIKRLNRICAETCTKASKLISLSLRTMTKLYHALVAKPNQRPSAQHLQEILAYVSCAIRIWAETVDREEYMGYLRPELKRNDRLLARAAHLQYCGHILLTICRMTWPENQHVWIEETQIIFDKEAQDFSEAFIFDGSLTYRYILEAYRTVLDSNGPRKLYVVLHKLDKLRHDGIVTKKDWHQPDPALPLLQDFVKLAKKRKRDEGEEVYGIDDSDGGKAADGGVKAGKKAKS